MENSEGRKLYAGGTYKDGLHGKDIHGNIIDTDSYHRGNIMRKKFVEETRKGVKGTPVPRRPEEPNSRPNEQIIKQGSLNEALRFFGQQSELSKARKAEKNRLEKQRAYRAKKIKGRLKILGVASIATILALVGGTKIADKIDASKTVNLEQALQSGQTLQDLGISQEARGALANLEIDFGGDNMNSLTNQELIEKASELEKLQNEMFETKLRKALGLADKGTIDVTTIGDQNQKIRGIKISGNNIDYNQRGFYTPDNFSGKLLGHKTYSMQIDKYIDSMESVKNLNAILQKANIDRASTITTLSGAVNETDKFAAGVIKTDEKGNIKFEAERLSEYEKNLKTANVQKDDDLEL